MLNVFYTAGHDNVDLKGTTVINIDENIVKIKIDFTWVMIFLSIGRLSVLC